MDKTSTPKWILTCQHLENGQTLTLEHDDGAVTQATVGDTASVSEIERLVVGAQKRSELRKRGAPETEHPGRKVVYEETDPREFLGCL